MCQRGIRTGTLYGVFCIFLLAGMSASAATLDSRFDPDDFASLGTLDISFGTITFNTDTRTATGSGGAPSFSNGVFANTSTTPPVQVTVFTFASVSITELANAVITGSRPIAILSTGNMSLWRSIGVNGGNGGGSGGSILLSAPTVVNLGRLSVVGGNGGSASTSGYDGGGGGGGDRVAIYTNTLIGDTVSVAGGGDGPGSNPGSAGAAGSEFRGDYDPPPTVSSIVRLNPTPTNAATVRFRVTFSEAVTGVAMSAFQAIGAGVTGASVTGVTNSGAGLTWDVTVATGSGDGTLGVNFIDLDTVVDGGGNPVGGTGQRNGDFTTGEVYTIDKSGPTISIGVPSASLTRGGPITYTVTYGGAGTITLAAGNVSLVPTGMATGTVSIQTVNATTRTVTLSGISGNGTLGISIAAGTASDAAGNAAPGISGDPFTVDNTAPTLVIGAPSTPLTRNGTVSYTVTYTGADTISLVAGNVTLNKTGTANGTVGVVNSGPTARRITVSAITGTGSLGIAVAGGSASDLAGNLAPDAGPSATFSVDNTAPSVAIGPPSVPGTSHGPVTFTITYGDASTVTFDASDVTLHRTGTANGSVAVGGTGSVSRTVTLSSISGTGTLAISIGAGSAADAAGNEAGAAGPSGEVNVDDARPAVTLGPPSTGITRHGPVTILVTYADASSITLAPGNVALNTTGGVTGTVSVSGSGSEQRTITVSNITGDGTFSISIAAGTAVNALGNGAFAAGPSATVAVDNTPPVIAVLGNALLNIEYSTPYVDAGATATDNRDGVSDGKEVASGHDPLNPNDTPALPAAGRGALIVLITFMGTLAWARTRRKSVHAR